MLSVFKISEDPSNINKPELIHKVKYELRNKEHMFEELTKLKLPRTANPDDTATLQTTNNEVLANTEPMLDYIFDDEDASTSINQNYIIDVPYVLEMMDTQDPDPMINTEKEQKIEETMLIPVPHMDFAHCALKDKSPHHQCTYSDCQVTGSMFFDNPSKKCNTKTCTHQLHRVCNIYYASDKYGEYADLLPMKKLCKVCLEKSAIEIGVKKVK